MRQGPDVRYEEVLRLVLLNVLELQVWQLGQPAKQSKNIWYEAKNKCVSAPVPGELRGSEPHHLLHLVHGEAAALALAHLLQPGAHVDEHDGDVAHQVLRRHGD